jgi:hypothetical protein
MQVTHERDHVTHAVIGGSQTIDFGISDNAEFFNILSSTLYKDQMLAVVREVLCNAWDAHIEAGCTDIPIQVSFENNSMIVRDFGHGIHKDNIGPIYGVYGSSTKKNDGKQTGGFGLGCKAPFAYTDHFEVISHHQGEMTIYAMSKSSADVAGKPGITPIMSAPTTSSGLQVTIKIKTTSDYTRFRNLVKMVAYNGDMNATIDSEPIKTIGFPETSPYLITLNDQDNHITSLINVRYGNVIYPVDSGESIEPFFKETLKIINHIRSYNYYFIIFQAPPHSISVTPSRESLSMQEHTCKTLVKLMSDFIKEYNDNFNKLTYKVTKEIIESSKPDLNSFFNRNKSVVGGIKIPNVIQKITTIDEYTKYFMSKSYPDNWAFRKYDIKTRINYLIDKKVIDRGLASSYLKELDCSDPIKEDKNCYYNPYNCKYNKWFQQRILAPIVKKQINDPVINLDSLYVCDNSAYSSKESKYAVNKNALVLAKHALFSSLIGTLPYLRNVIVLTHSKSRLSNAVQIYENEDDTDGISVGSGFLVYVVPRKKGAIDDVKKFFSKTNLKVIEFLPKESKVVTNNTEKKEIKPKRKGIPVMNSVFNTLDEGINLRRLKENTDIELIEHPAFYLRVSLRKYKMYYIPGFSTRYNKMLFEKYGHLGGIVTTSAQENSWSNKGIPSFTEYVAKEVINYFKDNMDTTMQYWSVSPDRVENLCMSTYSTGISSIIKFIYKTPILKTYFNIANHVSDIDMEYVKLMHILLNRFSYFNDRIVLVDILDQLNKTPIDNSIVNLVDKIEKSPFKHVLYTNALNDLIINESDVMKKMKAVNIFLDLLNW